jgi:hypothetical protein
MENLDMNPKDLENALSSTKKESAPVEDAGKAAEEVKLSPEEELGFHKGALNTLVAERNELVKMVGNVESIMQAHIERLKELGVDIK